MIHQSSKTKLPHQRASDGDTVVPNIFIALQAIKHPIYINYANKAITIMLKNPYPHSKRKKNIDRKVKM